MDKSRLLSSLFIGLAASSAYIPREASPLPDPRKYTPTGSAKDAKCKSKRKEKIAHKSRIKQRIQRRGK